MPPKFQSGETHGSAEEALDDLKRRYHLLVGDRNAYYETSQWTIRHNKETLSELKKEVKELQQALSKVHREKGQSLKATMSLEVDKVRNQVNALRRKVDDAKCKTKKRATEVDSLTDKYKEVEKLAAPPISDDSPLARKIRTLENRLDKAMIKYNESQSIKKTYEQILKRLSDERVGFDNQLQSIESQVKAREQDLGELRLMMHDATHARDVARQDLARYQRQIEDERTTRNQELSEMRTLVQTKEQMSQRMEKKDRRAEAEEEEDRAQGYVGRAQEEKRVEENQEKVGTYEEAFRKIKEATGVTDVNDVISKFLSQEDTHKSLQAMTKEAQARIDALTEEKVAAKARVEEIKYSATGSAGSHRVIDEFSAQLSEAGAKCERNKAKYERAAKILINVKAGVEHLNDKLEAVKSEIGEVSITDSTIVDALNICEHKLTRLLDALRESAEMSDDESADEEMKKLAGAQQGGGKGLYGMQGTEPSPYNLRINLPSAGPDATHDDDDDSDEDDQGDILDRTELKKRAAIVQEKAARKPRRGKSSGKKSSAGGGAVSQPTKPGLQ